MAGLVTPRFDVRGKVRIGERVQRGGKEFPTSTDHFLSDDAEFRELYSEPSEIRVVLPYDDPELCFVQTLENWRGSVLFCRSDDGSTAYRKTSNGRDLDVSAAAIAIDCPHRQCEFYREGRAPCRETGRLRFFLAEGSNRSSVLEFSTHGYGSLEKLAAVVALAGRMGPLALCEGTLQVRIEQKGQKRFPVVSLDLDRVTGSDRPDDVDEVKKILREIGEYDNPDYRAYVDRVGATAALVELRRHPAYVGVSGA